MKYQNDKRKVRAVFEEELKDYLISQGEELFRTKKDYLDETKTVYMFTNSETMNKHMYEYFN